MIIDSHAYCFDALDSPRGYASGEEHLQWAQAANASHHQPAMRIPDGELGPSDVLDPAGTHDIDNLPDLRFRVNKPRGRVVWNWEGREYTKYFLPPNLRNTEFTPFSLDSEMHYAGVDGVLLHTDPALVRDSSYLQEIVERFPGRMFAMAPVEEWRIIPETDTVIAETVRAIEEHGLHAVKFIPPLCYRTSDEAWDDGRYRPFWEAVTALGVPIFFTLGAGPDDLKGVTRTKAQEQRGYLDEHRTLMRWMERYPDAVCSLTHGFPWRTFLNDEQLSIELPDEIWEPFSNPNVSIEVCFPVRLGDIFEYPYREVWPTLGEMLERIGPANLMWGTDMPFQNRFCTYRQSRQWIEGQFSDWAGLSDDDLSLVMGGTAARVLGVG
ncbi:MAG: amidohydrolase family protein [Chloroflexota bacterium]|nr:amidohydrolase family protein [Chloroflexota bacterium]